MSRPWGIALAIAAFAWLLYARTLTADFVWDARAKVLGSDFIHNPANLPDVLTGRVLTRDVLDNNRPGNLLSLMIDAALWGKSPAGYHATSITLHALACAMLFLLLARLLEGQEWREGAAALGALVFAAHPLNCESVCEVSYREDLLVLASILAALLAAMEFMRKPGRLRNALLGALCCLALLYGVSAKENGAAGLAALAAYWLLWRGKEPRRPWSALAACATLLVAGFLVARFTLRPAHSIIFTQPPGRLGGSLGQTLLIQPRIWAMEFTQVIAPHALCADYGGYSLRDLGLGTAAVIVALVIAGQLLLAWRARLFAFGAILFWAGLLPVANLVPLYRPMADRFLYVPLAGVAMIVAQGLAMAGGKLRPAVYSIAILWICWAASLTFRREAIWHDSLTLWQATAADNPYSETAANNLGWALLKENRNAEAGDAFIRDIRLTGGKDADPWAGLALACDAAGQSVTADQYFRRAAGLDARYAHPQELVEALVAEPDVAAKMEVLARRNSQPVK
jgi:hypothetical protein